MKVLLINTHLNYPNWSEGTLNNAMTDVAKSYFEKTGHEVIYTNVEDGYTPEEEVQKHVDAGLVILQTPVNWFSAPWIYKKYADEVFNYGLQNQIMLKNDGRTRSDPSRQYGTGGLMHGKKFFVAATWNAPTETFDNPESIMFGGLSADDFFIHITSNYKFTGYDVLPTYGIHDVFKEDANIKDGLAKYEAYLESVVKGF